MKLLINLFIFAFVYLQITAEFDIELSDAGETLSSASDALEKLNGLITNPKPAQLLAKISKTLSVLGPAMMAISAIISIVTLFLPQQDSPELVAIKEGFSKVNRKLDVMSTEIQNLESVVKLSAAQSAYAKTVTTIKSNHRLYIRAFESKNKEDFRFFQTKYENTFGLATEHLYDALVGANGAFGFNMVKLYSDSVNCNPIKISQFCLMGMDLINKGLQCESAYYGTQNFTSQVKAQSKMWAIKLTKLKEQCENIVNTCESNWESIGQKEFVNSYKKYLSGSNKDLATNIIRTVSKSVSQRIWFSVAYDDAGGFAEHCFSTYYNHRKIWNENHKDVTLFSTPQRTINEANKRSWLNNLENIYNRFVGEMTRMCYTHKVMNVMNDLSRYIVNQFRKSYTNGTVYVIFGKKKPGYQISGGYLFEKAFTWKCYSVTMQIYVFE